MSLVSGIAVALARRRCYDCILAVGLLPEGIVASIVGGILRRPFVLYAWVAGPSGGSVPRLERSGLAPLWRSMLSRASAYVGQTEEVAAELARVGFRSDCIHVVPVGIDLEAYSPADPDARRGAKGRLGVGTAPVALYHGRFDLRHKRLDLLLSSWASANLGDWRLVLAGDGPDAARVRLLARHLDPPPVFVGWQDDVRWLLSGADLNLLPTNYEGTSNAMAEAMAFGLPVIASRVPCHDRIRPDGVVLVPNDSKAWTTALVDLAGDADRREALGKRARAWVEAHYDARARTAAFASLLTS
jgi:glycosyltransferase involved in cell wall biosynthesis